MTSLCSLCLKVDLSNRWRLRTTLYLYYLPGTLDTIMEEEKPSWAYYWVFSLDCEVTLYVCLTEGSRKSNNRLSSNISYKVRHIYRNTLEENNLNKGDLNDLKCPEVSFCKWENRSPEERILRRPTFLSNTEAVLNPSFSVACLYTQSLLSFSINKRQTNKKPSFSMSDLTCDGTQVHLDRKRRWYLNLAHNWKFKLAMIKNEYSGTLAYTESG